MTEAEWLACDEPEKMVEFIRGKVSDRKLRLLACSCCRRTWNLLQDERSRRAVETIERVADGRGTDREREAAFEAAAEASHEANDGEEPPTEEGLAVALLTQAAEYVAGESTAYDPVRGEVLQYSGWLALGEISKAVAVLRSQAHPGAAGLAEADDDFTFACGLVAYHSLSADERRGQAELLRDTLGNPFRPASLDPAWQTPMVVSLAQAAYDDRTLPSGGLDPARLAVLADALEEAGCTGEAILSHLRSPGPHVRGCWALDLILGKE